MLLSSFAGRFACLGCRRLVEFSRELTVRVVPLEEIEEVDDAIFGADEAPTWRSFAAHCRLAQEADLSYPIIRAADGAVMDGTRSVKLQRCVRLDPVDGEQPRPGRRSDPWPSR